jgi:soluble lytic murein transglycosylase
MARLRAIKDQDAINNLIRDAWVNDDYSQSAESRMMTRYHSILSEEDYARRIDRLIWEGKYDDAKRLMRYASPARQHVFQARLSLAQDRLRRVLDLLRLSVSGVSDPGVLYEHIRACARKGDRTCVRAGLLKAPANVPYPEKWWPLRDRQIREALAERNPALAEALLARHGQKQGTISYREAIWLTGWIALEFRHDSPRAYKIFYELFKETASPNGRARVAYWAARATEANGHPDNAEKWRAVAGHYATTFYGQMALCEESPNGRVSIRSEPLPTAEERRRFAAQELVQLVHALGAAHQSDLAEKFIVFLVDNAQTPGEVMLATRLGHDIRRIDYGVRAAKRAMQNDIVVLQSGWPVISLPYTAGLEKPLVLGITRQESEFLADATSGANAIGLMQLLPGTAREIARRAGLPFAPQRLFDGPYNTRIGSMYLAKMLEKFDGSYVLAIASYNAGPGRVMQWVRDYGRPSGNARRALDWIETIPIGETRNYVQHVMENMEVYRYLLNERQPVKLELAENLAH